jgi:hypothetical protein
MTPRTVGDFMQRHKGLFPIKSVHNGFDGLPMREWVSRSPNNEKGGPRSILVRRNRLGQRTYTVGLASWSRPSSRFPRGVPRWLIRSSHCAGTPADSSAVLYLTSN